MKTKRRIIFPWLALFLAALCLAQTVEEDKQAVVGVIEKAYIGAARNDIDIDIVKSGFHESFTWQSVDHGRMTVLTLPQWVILLGREKWLRPDWNDRTSARIEVIGIEGAAAVARVDVYNHQVHDSTDFLSLYKFAAGWKITNRISEIHDVPPEIAFARLWEMAESITQKLHPPDQVMDAIGLRPGMTVGEIGAGLGRYTVHLARRVGEKGKVFANDIDGDALAQLRDKCQRENIRNVETILGKEEDPRFPKDSLDMAFMIWVFHGLEKPGALFAGIRPALKPGASLVIVDPVDSEVDQEREFAGLEMDPNRPTIKGRVAKAAEESGFEIVRVESFLPKDDIFILKAKGLA